MKTAIRIISIFLFAALAVTASAENWEELKGTHFLVYHIRNKEFAQNVLVKSEKYYKDIASDLGYPRYEEFWTWENRVKIYIHSDKEAYLKASGQPDWSEGMADYTNKLIMTHTDSELFLVSVLPHEIAHLIFRDFIGFKGEVPLWLDEGVAQWAESAKREHIKALVKTLYEEDQLLAIEDMMKLNMRILKEKNTLFIRPTRTRAGEKITLVLSTEHLINTYYIEAVSLVGFLISKYGSNRFASFCRELRDGKTTENALKSAYSDYIHSLSELEDKWRRYLEEGA